VEGTQEKVVERARSACKRHGGEMYVTKYERKTMISEGLGKMRKVSWNELSREKMGIMVRKTSYGRESE